MSSESEGQSSEGGQPSRRGSGLKRFEWKKGQSGNPNGRRAKGLASAERLRNALVTDLPEILKAIVTAAKAGDIQAARTILERVLPPLKAVEVPAILDDPLTGSLTEQGQGIIAAMARGTLTPGQTAQLLSALASQAKLIEVDELSRRLGAIEKRLGATDGHS